MADGRVKGIGSRAQVMSPAENQRGAGEKMESRLQAGVSEPAWRAEERTGGAGRGSLIGGVDASGVHEWSEAHRNEGVAPEQVIEVGVRQQVARAERRVAFAAVDEAIMSAHP